MESLDASCSWRRRVDGLWKLEAASWPFAAKISRPRRMKYQNSSDEAWLRQWLSLHTCSWNWHDLVAPGKSQRQQCLDWFFDGCHHMMSPLMCSLRCDSYRCNNNNNNSTAWRYLFCFWDGPLPLYWEHVGCMLHSFVIDQSLDSGILEGHHHRRDSYVWVQPFAPYYWPRWFAFIKIWFWSPSLGVVVGEKKQRHRFVFAEIVKTDICCSQGSCWFKRTVKLSDQSARGLWGNALLWCSDAICSCRLYGGLWPYHAKFIHV